MTRVLHVITGLDRGGAETMLHKLLSRMDRGRFQSEVLSLTTVGDLGRLIEQDGTAVASIGGRRGVPNAFALATLVRHIRRFRPDLVQTWLYHSDLLGGVAGRLAGVPVLWNLRSGDVDPHIMKRMTVLTMRACAALSPLIPRVIVACSERSRDVHVALGYAAAKMRVIPNGFDLEVFKPDAAARVEVRRELGIDGDAPVAGLVARYDPLKDHPLFLRAARMIADALPAARFLLCGSGMDASNPAIAGPLRTLGLTEHVHLLAERRDIPRVTASFDIACSTSFSEGFPNVIGEAMASGVPCVVTAAGDSALIVGDTGISVAPGDTDAFAAGCIEVLKLPADERAALGARARLRIAERFSIDSVVARYEELYQSMVSSL
jgi:glycosyltransferase involved in cell wall biosynthesis